MKTAKLLALFILATSAAAQVPAPATMDEVSALFSARKYAEARNLAQGFAEKNDPRAEVMLGTMFQRGLGVPVDIKQAQTWYTKAAEQGDVEGELALGMLLLNGTGEKPNVAEGAPWLQKAAEAGNVRAQYNLGLYYSGLFGTAADWPNAAKWFQSAADKGNPRAAYNLALLYGEGKGVAKDEVAAGKLMSAAAVKGLPEAALEYGIMVYQGKGVQKDTSLGAKWILIAAQHGNAVAQNRIARILGVGVDGVRQDPIEAMKWNILAKKAGRGDQDLDAAAAKADKGMVQDAKDRADRFKPLPDPTAE